MKNQLAKQEIEYTQDDFLKNKLINVINSGKSYHDILLYIQNEISESTRVIGFDYKIKCFKEDGAYALSRAVEEIHGFTTQRDEKKMSGSKPPTMIDVRFADGTRKKVPFGQIDLPSLGEGGCIEMTYLVGEHTLQLKGLCEKRFVRLMDNMVEKTRELVETDSIYKGRAIKIVNEDDSPSFIDLSGIDKIDLFLTPEAKYATEAVEARIEHTQRCIDKGIDLKYGMLLEGNYGTGKTLYAFKLASKAINNGWTFMYCPNPNMTLYIMETANLLASNGKGVVLFIEDIDKLLHERTDLTNEISVMMDGGETKNKNIVTIFTTNHVERIDPTFMRGKRIGTIVTLTYPDKDTAKQMIERYLVDERGKSILEEDCDEAAKAIADNQIVPAFIAEILDGVKAHLIYSGRRTVSCTDIISSIKNFKRQMEIATVREANQSDAELFVEYFRKIMGSNGGGSDVVQAVREVLESKGF